jgi:hypothetical protein
MITLLVILFAGLLIGFCWGWITHARLTDRHDYDDREWMDL